MPNLAAALVSAACLAIAAAASTPAAAAEFSADLVVSSGTAPTAPAIGKVFVAGGKIRIEDPRLPNGVFLVDQGSGAVLFYRPGRKVVMDARETSVLTQLLVPLVPQQPCTAWQRMAEIVGAAQQGGVWRCRSIQPPASAAAGMLSYEAMSPRNTRYEIMIDAARAFPVRIDNPDRSVVTLENVRDSALDAALFELPAGLRKFDPQQLIDRVKQSDVWVEPPK